jgi:hypothetical protein
MSKNKKQNDGVRDPSPIKKSTSASPITTQASTELPQFPHLFLLSLQLLLLRKEHVVLRLVHELCQRAPVVQVVVQKVILQNLHTVLHVLLVLLGNLALHAILILVRHLLVIYLMLFLMMMPVCRRLLLRINMNLCSVLARVSFRQSRYIITVFFSGV